MLEAMQESQKQLKAIQKSAPGISVAQLILLQEIAMREGCRVNELSKQLRKDPRDIGYQLHMLSDGKKGRPNTGLKLVKLKVCKEDGRGRQLFLSAKGKRILKILNEQFDGDGEE